MTLEEVTTTNTSEEAEVPAPEAPAEPVTVDVPVEESKAE